MRNSALRPYGESSRIDPSKDERLSAAPTRLIGTDSPFQTFRKWQLHKSELLELATILQVLYNVGFKASETEFYV